MSLDKFSFTIYSSNPYSLLTLKINDRTLDLPDILNATKDQSITNRINTILTGNTLLGLLAALSYSRRFPTELFRWLYKFGFSTFLMDLPTKGTT